MMFKKVYRAIPQLSRFDDATCKRFMAGAARDKPLVWYALLVSAVPGILMLFITCFISAVIAGAALGFDVTASSALLFLACIVSGALTMLVIIVLYRWYLFEAMMGRVVRTTCRCRCNLLGLTPLGGVVECPSCQRRVVLANRGVTPEMMLAGTLGDRALHLCSCGYSLGDLSVHHGGVRCPECGRVSAVN